MHCKTRLLGAQNAVRFSGTGSAASAESGRQATDALGTAAEMLAGGIPGRRPDAEVARAWAEIGQVWATLSHAEAARSIAAAAFAVDQGGVSTFPT
jgi:hypothetical protein